ncbi:MAG: pantetheine-phosphate adenylyltransferase [Spirochaetes bacterium]|nr:pantetheine-phosphate adenylyltransferase [Spirochaetota bacterium]
MYPGSFDPITNGHLDIIKRAANIFPSLVVAVSSDAGTSTLFSTEERCKLIEDACDGMHGIKVVSFSGLLVKFVMKNNANVIIRGLRAVTDFEYEFSMALMNKHLEETVETVFLSTRVGNSFISSSLIKEVYRLGGNVRDNVPANVFEALKKIKKENRLV